MYIKSYHIQKGGIYIKLDNKNIAFILTGAFSSFENVIMEMKKISELNANIYPIMSYNAFNIDTRYGTSKSFIELIEKTTNKKVIHTVKEAEDIIKNTLIDITIIAPATSNTIAKIVNDINDTPATVAVKTYLAKNKPIVVAISVINGLGESAQNIGILLNRKNFYFVPYRQTNPITKPKSLYFDYKYITKTIEEALEDKQVQPLLL